MSCPIPILSLLRLGLALVGVLLSGTLVLPLSAQSTAEVWRNYIATHAVALEGPDDAAKLLPYLDGRELILLGETTHGTHEYYVWRAAITQALVEQGDLRFVAVEGDWHLLDRLDRYVRHKADAPASARAALMTFDRWPEWMWANPVIEAMAEWLHEWNASQPPEKRVGIHGIDVYGWGESAAQLPDYLEALEPGWGERARRGLNPLIAMGGDSHAFHRAVLQSRATGADKLNAIHERLETDGDQLKSKNPSAYAQARQHAALVKQAKAHLRKNAQGHPRSWNPRAENFMATINRLRDYYGDDARGVVWAHNTHIGDSRYTPMRNYGMFTIGQQAREMLGEDRVYLLGFASDQGTFRAGRQWGQPGEVMRLPPADPLTFDHWLQEAAPPEAFIPMDEARGNPLLRLQAGHRAIGVVHGGGTDMRQNYVPSVIPLRYDGIIYLRESRALDELER